MHDYADTLWIQHWCAEILRGVGKHESLLVVCRRKKNMLPDCLNQESRTWCAAADMLYSRLVTKGPNLLKVVKIVMEMHPRNKFRHLCRSFDSLTSPSLNLHSPQPAHCHLFLCTHLPLFLSFLSLSHSLSLPIPFSVGGLHKKVVHFWICCFFEVQPSLPPLFSLSSAHLLSYLLCHLQHPPVSMFYFYLFIYFLPTLLYFFPRQTPGPRFLQLFLSPPSLLPPLIR